ncbi:MAG: multicopper oxidase domain-containing protein [Gammaproteobacteria bacterium]
MQNRSFVCFLLSIAFAWAGGLPQADAASPPRPQVGACGITMAPHDVQEPPDVAMWNAPLDASGEHELILGVHHDGERFCYRYTWEGVVHTMAPTIRVRRGEHFAIRIADDIAGQSRGESVASTALPPCKPMQMPAAPVQHYIGYLNHIAVDRYFHSPATDTNLHLHGFEGPAFEENVFLSSLSTPMHACEYHVTIPRTQPPGTYLYHPHAHGSSDDEVAFGLDGAWIVEPDTQQIPRSAEHVIVLRYRIPFEFDKTSLPNGGSPDKVDAAQGAAAAAHEAALRSAPAVAYDPFNPPPWPDTFPMRVGGVTLDATGCNGFGSEPVIAVNGTDTPASLAVAAGQTQLLRLVNGTSDSPKNLVLRDASGKVKELHVVGLDGVPVSGDMQHPLHGYLVMKKLMVSPMSRADILLAVPAGKTYMLSSEPFCEGKDAFFQRHHDLLRISTAAASGLDAKIHSVRINPTDTPAARLVAWARAHPALIHRRAITFTEYKFPKRGKAPSHHAYYITDTTKTDFHEHPFWPVYREGATVPSNPDIVVKQGTIEEWYLINATMEAHAFHIHQMAYVQEYSYMDIPVTVDTTFVPVGRLLPNPRDPNYPLIQPSITRIILDFRHVPRGTFVFHCHMLYHEDHGMMGVIKVK